MMNRQTTVIVLAGGLVMFLALGIRQGFGLFLAPMSLDLGWGREDFALAIALQNLIWGICQPFTGMIADQYGARRVVVLGGALYVAGLALMATTAGPAQLHLGAGFVLGIALSAVTFAVVLGAVGKMVAPERRGLALGFVSAGGSAGQFLVVPTSQALIDGMGWGAALLVLAAAAFVIMPLGAAFAGARQAQGTQTAEPAQSLGQALGEAGRHRGYWLLVAGFFVCGFHVTFIMVHLPAFITDSGLPAWLGGAALALVGFFNIIGTFVCGALGDRYRKKYVLSLLYLARAGVIAAFLALPITESSVLAFASAMGLLWLGTVPLTSGLVAQIFGVRYMTTLFGVVFLSHQIGAFLGAWLGGYVFDLTGSYTQVWVAAIVLGLAAALLHWPIADRPVPRLLRPAE